MRRETLLEGATAILMLAALLSLTRVFTEGSWWTPTLLAIGVPLALAATARRLGIGSALAALVSLVGLAVYVSVIHLPGGSLLPGGAELTAARELLGTAMLQLRETPAPTVPLDGLVFIVGVATWVVTHATHEVLVRWRHAGLALVPAAVLWSVPLAMPMPPGRTWPQALPFLAAGAVVLLLESDNDVSGFTRESRSPGLSGAGASLAVVALLLAVAIPTVLPGYQTDAWLEVGGASNARGLQPIVDIGDRLKLPAERDVLRVQGERRSYLRLAALDSFDGATWRLGPPDQATFSPDPAALFPASAVLPAETPIAAAAAVTTNIEVLDLENIYVPVPYQPVQLRGDVGEMFYSTTGGFLFTAELEDNELAGNPRTGVKEGLEYQVSSVTPTPTREQLEQVAFDPSQIAPYLQLPGSYDRHRELTEQITTAAGATSVLDRALAVQDWFIGPDSDFTYTTDVPQLRGSGALDTFLFDEEQGKQGYCEYFATAMAVMLRASGIPARVAVGFLGGRLSLPADPQNGRPLNEYTISSGDAHAWVEVLFPGFGWIKFDPTPRSDGGTQVPSSDNLAPDLTVREERLAAIEAGDPAQQDDTSEITDFLPEGNPFVPVDNSGGVGGAASRNLPAILGGGLALLLLGAGGLVLLRRRRGAPAQLDPVAEILAAQRRVLRAAAGLGLARHQSETTADLARRWSEEGRTDPLVAARFAALAQSAAFGGGVTDDRADDRAYDRADDVGALADQLIEQLRESVTSRDRAIAPVRVPLDSAVTTGRRTADRVREVITSQRRDR